MRNTMITMSTHTPGPWDYHMADGAEVAHIAIFSTEADGSEDERICDVYDEANVSLICAAPDLLAALEELLHSTERDDMNARVRAMEAARETITKAQGGAA